MAKPLEQKVISLEKRLAMVERFLHLRYCESFQDFSIRNGGATTGKTPVIDNYGPPPSVDTQPEPVFDEPIDDADDDYEEPQTVVKSSRGRVIKVKKPGDGRVAPKPTPTPTRKLTVQLDRIDQPDPPTGRYGTRQQTKSSEDISVSAVQQVKQERENLHDGADDEDDYISPNEDENDYFSFPEDGGPDAHVEMDDHEDPLDVDYETPESVTKAKRRKKACRPSATKKYPRKRPTHYLASFSRLSEDSRNGLINNDPDREQCPICKQYWKKDKLRTHIESHTKEKTNCCSQCDKSYSTMDELKHHIKMAHEREKHFPKCRICHTPIVRKMITHERFCVRRAIQKGEDVDPELVEDVRKQCIENGLKFALPDEDVPPGCDPTEKLECPKCERFFQRRYYDKHVKMHSMERNWKCGKCPNTYIHKHDLVRHMCRAHDNTAERAPAKEQKLEERESCPEVEAGESREVQVAVENIVGIIGGGEDASSVI